MDRLTETKIDREIRISFAYIDHIFNEACKKLDELKKDYEPIPREKEVCTIHERYMNNLLAQRNVNSSFAMQNIYNGRQNSIQSINRYMTNHLFY